MKRKLFKQICNEWRANLWLTLELIIISAVLWYIYDITAVRSKIASEPMGVDIDGVFKVELSVKSPNSPGYVKPIPADGEDETAATIRSIIDDSQSLIDRLRQRPDVAAAAIGVNEPYSYNYYGTALHIADERPDSLTGFLSSPNRFEVSPEYLKVFDIHGVDGETPEQLADIIERGDILLSQNALDMICTSDNVHKPIDPAALKREIRLYLDNDSSRTYRIGALIPGIKRSESEPASNMTMILKPANYQSTRNVYLRIRPGVDPDDFRRDILKESASTLTVGNTFISDIVSFRTIRDELHRGDDAEQRNFFLCMVFLLVTVFLGLLGTFWFRTQQRVRELAIRKVTGAPAAGIFRRLISEGLILLAVATPFALAIDALLIHYELPVSTTMIQYYWTAQNPWLFGLKEAVIVAMMIAVMIIAGIFFPAWRAMRIAPADVLRDE